MRTLVVFATIAALSGCSAVDTMKEGFTHAEEVSTDMEKAVGSRPFVGFNWSNGSLTSINITFDGIPEGKSTPEIADLAKRSIASHFKQEPKRVVISFSLPGESN